MSRPESAVSGQGAAGSEAAIRPATPGDAAGLLAIYAPFVAHTAVSFETQVPSVQEFAARIGQALDGWAWLLAESHGQCIGYAYATSHRSRAAYRWSVETSAYVAPDWHRRGVGRRLYVDLFAALVRRGYCNAYAGIALPNPASVALHQAVGFEPVGVFKSVGRKFERWHDVSWWQRPLREQPLPEPGQA
jgi:L-amino acid N-acyltransferase YncA